MDPANLAALWLSLQLACVSTLVLLCLGIPLAWWLAQSRWRGKACVEALIAMPLVLPPTVLGFYLLLVLSPHSWLGRLIDYFGLAPLPFSFAGLVIGSVIYSLPFVVQPITNAFAAIGQQPLNIASTLGASPVDRFFSLALPLARTGISSGAILGFAHTLGEFGVVLMLGGNIPGKTRVVSIAIYDHVEMLDYANAHWLAGILLVVSFVMLLSVYGLNRRAGAAKLLC